MSHSQRYFEMLGAAYEVPSGPDRFDAFLAAAMAYFFEDEAEGLLAGDVPRYKGDDKTLDTHGQRIGALIEEASRRGSEKSERFHAVLDISARSELVTGNTAAAHLTDRDFPCHLCDLPLDPEAISEIRKSLRSGEHQPQDRIILASVGERQVQACLALIQRPKDIADRVQVSLSYIDWSDALMTRLGEAFGLTHSETEILEGYLANLSQKEIAQQRDRSLETIKGQSKAILRKTGCARMSDVVQLCASIAFLMRQLPEQETPPSAETWMTPKENLSLLPRLKGRKLAWYTAGDGEKPVLFIHGYLQGPFFTPAFRRALAQINVRLIAPSRPGFGYTSPSPSDSDFNETVVRDALALVDHLGLEKISLCVHQGGTSHGFRIARALGRRMGDMLVIGGGIPIDEKVHLSHMDRQTRFAAMATRHAPSVMKMVTSIGLPVYRRRGTRAFLEKQFSKSPADLATLSNSTLMKVQAEGLYHAVEQGAGAWVRDGAAAMADWTDDLEAVDCRQIWLQANDDSIISAQDVAACITKRTNAEFHILDGHGTNILHTAVEDITDALARLQ
ncbi:alpha/beta fold hydrolase [Henriciella litoralis]|uniref:alpha/beta fold hydrolase n=1 Tax=Henriciella litoralis TaxID=568102 RepID=UPI00111C3C0A|nr:alpha/beta fold hydrolase [Henriciella litoralis]